MEWPPLCSSLAPWPRLPAGATLPLRSDAERNRRALVRAARAVFGERGLDAPLDEIARRAEVGNATLYRRFPTRCALLAAVFADTLEDVVAATERAIAESGPVVGVRQPCDVPVRVAGH